jgi:hypothetical protein
MLFWASVYPVLLVVALHYTWPLTQIIRHFNRRTIGSSDVEDFAAKILLLASSRPSDEPMHTTSVHLVLKSSKLAALYLELKDCQMNRRGGSGSSGATTSILARLCLFLIDHQIERLSNQPDHQFIRCHYLLLLRLFHSSDACRNWTVGSSDCVFCCFLCFFNLPSLELNIPSLNIQPLNIPSLIASKYIWSPHFFYAHVNLRMSC